MNTQELTELTELLHSTGYARREIEEAISDLKALDTRAEALGEQDGDWIVGLTDEEVEELVNLHREEIKIAVSRLRVRERALCREFHRLTAQLAEGLEAVR